MSSFRSKDSMNKGFTFVEILVVVSLVVVIAASLFSGIVFGERTTGDSIVKSDGMAVAHLCFQRLAKVVQLCDTIEYPIADKCADYAIVRERNGARWAIRLSEDKLKVVLVPLSEGSSLLLASTKRTILKYNQLEFANLSGKDLRMTVSFENVNKKRAFRGSLDFSKTFVVGR